MPQFFHKLIFPALLTGFLFLAACDEQNAIKPKGTPAPAIKPDPNDASLTELTRPIDLQTHPTASVKEPTAPLEVKPKPIAALAPAKTLPDKPVVAKTKQETPKPVSNTSKTPEKPIKTTEKPVETPPAPVKVAVKKPAEPSTPKPVASAPKPVASPAPKPVKKTAVKPTAKPAEPAKTVDTGEKSVRVTPEQLALIDSIQQKNLKLILDMTKAEQKITMLSSALREARETTGKHQSELNRNRIELEILRREIANLKEQKQATSQPTDEKTSKPAKPLSPDARENLLDLMGKLKQLQRDNEKLKLQLKLASLDEKDARLKTLLKEVEQNNTDIDALESTNKQLSHRIVAQAGEVSHLKTQVKADQQALANRDAQIADLSKKLDTLQLALQTARRETLVAQTKARTAEQARIEAEKVRDRALALASRTGLSDIRRPASTPPTNTTSSTTSTPPASTTTAGTAKPKSKTLSGKITNVNDVLLTVNIGKKDGLKNGMRLIVYRDDRFIGYLQIGKVLDDSALGTMTRQIIEPKLGDNVIDRLE